MVRIKSAAHGVEIGSEFGSWKAIGPPFSRGSAAPRSTTWAVVAQCKCGAISVVRCDHLSQGKTTCCQPCNGDKKATHGQARDSGKSRLYVIWCAIIQRCTNENNDSWEHYGGRGIAVCQEWRESFQVFCQWAESNGYSSDLEIDRRNNDLGYDPGNCRWITHRENILNSSHARMVTAFGETKPMVKWSEDSRCVVSNEVLRGRLRLGWSAERAMTTPKLRAARA